MTLEDFFTLTEMKNGLATVSRVEELISILKQQKDCVLGNVGDTTRQWSSVVSTLAATENKDCLNHFVQLNGLYYLNQWLQEVLKCSNDILDIAVEEFINASLGSLERLPIYKEESISSGIQLTVEQLLDFKSSNIKERARALFERWENADKNDGSYQDTNKEGSCTDERTGDGQQSLNVVADNSTCKEQTEEAISPEKSAGTELAEAAPQLEKTNMTSTADQSLPATSLSSAVANANLGDRDTVPSTLVSNSCQENYSAIEESSVCPASVDADDGHCDASELEDDTIKEVKMEVDSKEGSTSESVQTESCKVPSSSGLSVSAVLEKPQRSVSCNIDSKERISPAFDTTQTLPRSASIDCVAPKYLKTLELKPIMQDLLSNVIKLRKTDDPVTFNSEDDLGDTGEVKELGRESNLRNIRVDTVISCLSPRKTKNNISMAKMDHRSELGLEYGEIDALEVARQVAIEVEREVVDYREPFCSSSPEGNSGEVTGFVEEAKQDQPENEEQNKSGLLQSKDDPDGSSSSKDDQLRISETNTDLDKCEQGAETSMPVTHISGDDGNEQSRCDFDLNEDVCMEEPGCLINTITNNSFIPIAVTASKGSPPFLVSPLRFEGEQGWKGSAATSAFRPTSSSRKTPDTDKISSGQKRKAKFFEIDLNVAESGEDAVDPLSSSVKPLLVSTGNPPREDSVEVSSGRADRLKLDLNRLGDEDVSPHPSMYWSLPHQNGDKIMSPASSSSPRQPSMRDFDLNDNPNFFDALGSCNLGKSSSTVISGMYGSSKPENPVITIMGSRITERKDCLNSFPQSFIGNGPSTEATAMAPRPMIPYGHYPIPAYGYSGPVMGPPMPFPPYMVDSRGTTVVPQILGSPGLSSASSSVPPFLMSISNIPSGLTGAGSSHSGLDLNTGIMSMDMASREGEGFKHLFMQGRNGLMEDGVKSASQPAGAPGLSLNRKKEAESGWEPYTFGYKQVTSWQ